MRWRYAASMPVLSLLPLLCTAGVVALVNARTSLTPDLAGAIT